MSLLLLTIHDITEIIVQMVFYTWVKNYRAVNSLYPSFSTVSATELPTCKNTLLFIGDFFYVSVDYRRCPLALVINLNCFHIKLVFGGRRFFAVPPTLVILMLLLKALVAFILISI